MLFRPSRFRKRLADPPPRHRHHQHPAVPPAVSSRAHQHPALPPADQEDLRKILLLGGRNRRMLAEALRPLDLSRTVAQ